jgi:acetyl-CoA carboxylase carboxyltransferase component
LATVKQEQLEKRGAGMSDKEVEEFKRPILDKYAVESSAYYSTSRLWDDGVIDPKDTRKVLALALSVSFNKKWPDLRQGVLRM